MITIQAKRLESRNLKKLVKAIIPKSCLDSFEVGVAGSCVLDWNAVREGDCMDWWPGDLDIFVCGQNGLQIGMFIRFMNTVMANLRSARYNVLHVDTHMNGYNSPMEMVYIRDIVIEGFSTKISFIQCPMDATVFDTVERFDLDTVTVVYDFSRNAFHTQNWHRADGLKVRKMAVCPFVHELIAKERIDPGGCEQRMNRLLDTVDRIAKYQRRGWEILDGASIDDEIRTVTNYYLW